MGCSLLEFGIIILNHCSQPDLGQLVQPLGSLSVRWRTPGATFEDDFPKLANVLTFKFAVSLNFEPVQPEGAALGGSPFPVYAVSPMELFLKQEI